MVKRLATFFLLPGPGFAAAQRSGQVDPSEMLKRSQEPAAMQKLLQQAETARKCTQEVDQTKLESLRQRAETIARQIERLCADGKAGETRARALSLSREIRSDATLAKIRECTRGISQTIAGVMPSLVSGLEAKAEPPDRDICN